MKQKIVIKVSMNGTKSRTKSLKITVGVAGVESVNFGGQDKNQIEVTGDSVDVVKLTTLLRKNVGFAELVSVSAVGEKKKEQKNEKKDDPKAQNQSQIWYYGSGVPRYVNEFSDPNQYQYNYTNSCSII